MLIFFIIITTIVGDMKPCVIGIMFFVIQDIGRKERDQNHSNYSARHADQFSKSYSFSQNNYRHHKYQGWRRLIYGCIGRDSVRKHSR